MSDLDGYGVAVRRVDEPPIQGEPFVSLADALNLLDQRDARIRELEAENARLTTARAIDVGLMDGMKLVIKQLEAERDGAYAAGCMASAEVAMAQLANTTWSPNSDYGMACADVTKAIQALTTMPPEYVAVRV